MDRQLKDLRRHMTDAKFRHLNFSEESKRQVLEQIKVSRTKKKRYLPSMWWKSGLSIAVCTVLLIGGISIAVHQSDSQSEASSSQKVKYQTHKSSSHDTAAKPSTQQYPPIKDPGPLTKEEIQNRMLNTEDYFITAKGSYTMTDAHQTITNQFQVLLKEGDQFRSYSKKTDSQNGVNSITIDNGTDLLEIFPQRNSYSKMKSVPYKKGSPVTMDSVFSKAQDGKQSFSPRGGPPVKGAEILFPYNYAGSFLRDTSKWDIVKQDGMVAGQKAIVVKGTSTRHDIKSFEFWISRATGILLKLKFYDGQGNVIETIETTNLQLNKPVDMSKFAIQVPKGYTDQLKKMWEQSKMDPRVNQIKDLGGAKSGGQGDVGKVFQNVQAHVPFLYTFKGNDIFLYSGDLQKYKTYYQTTLGFIPDYQKNDVAKKGTDHFLFVQEYNKNSFIRQKGNDFVKADEFKKHSVKSFTMNGIDWKGYTVMRQPDFPETYMMGTKGNYVYEVVGQYLSFDKVKECLKFFQKD